MGLRVGFRVTTASRQAATLLRKPEQLSLCSGKRESECKKLRAERVRPTSARGVLSKQRHVNKQGATPGEHCMYVCMVDPAWVFLQPCCVHSVSVLNNPLPPSLSAGIFTERGHTQDS